MSSRRVLASVLMLAALGCPLDRQDGGLLITAHVPEAADWVSIEVEAGGLANSLELRAPFGWPIDDFSAVPAGQALVRVTAYVDQSQVGRGATQVLVREGSWSEVEVALEAPEGVRVDTPIEGEGFHVRKGPVPIVISNPTPDVVPAIEAVVEGQKLSLVANATGWIGSWEPNGAPGRVPRVVTLEVRTQYPDGSSRVALRSFELHRNLWRVQVEGRARASLGPNLLVGDRAGRVKRYDAQGRVLFESNVGEEIVGLAESEALALVMTRPGHWLVLSASGEETRLSGTFEGATAPRLLGKTVFAAVEATIYRVDLVEATVEAWKNLPNTVRAPVLVDEKGVVAADLQGNVIVVGSGGEELYRGTCPEPVLAAPVRWGESVLIAGARTGMLCRVGRDGTSMLPSLEAPVVFAPLVAAEGFVAVAGDQFWSVRGVERQRTLLGSPATTSPQSWDGAHVVGLADGRVVRVSAEGRLEVLSWLPGTVFDVIPWSSEELLVAVTSDGRVEAIDPEGRR